LEIAGLRGKIDGLGQKQAEAQQREERLRDQLAEQLARGEQMAHDFEQERSRRLQLEQSLGDLQHRLLAGGSATGGGVVSLALAPGRVRDAGQPSLIEMPQSVKALRLRLSLERGGHLSYHAVLQTDEGRQIWNRDDLRPRGIQNDERVEVVVPARLLVP